MEAVLLDTDVFSFFFKRDSRRELYVDDVIGRQLCLSFMSVAELRKWAIIRNWGRRRRARLDETLRHYVILPFDDAMAQHWAEVYAHRGRQGKPISCGDCWIAASALRHDLTLVSHNAEHYADIMNLRLISHR
jgi:tRNA(fMet)-specific endonuclease VapC